MAVILHPGESRLAYLVRPRHLDLLNWVTHAEVTVPNGVTEILHCWVNGDVIYPPTEGGEREE